VADIHVSAVIVARPGSRVLAGRAAVQESGERFLARAVEAGVARPGLEELY